MAPQHAPPPHRVDTILIEPASRVVPVCHNLTMVLSSLLDCHCLMHPSLLSSDEQNESINTAREVGPVG